MGYLFIMRTCRCANKEAFLPLADTSSTNSYTLSSKYTNMIYDSCQIVQTCSLYILIYSAFIQILRTLLPLLWLTYAVLLSILLHSIKFSCTSLTRRWRMLLTAHSSKEMIQSNDSGIQNIIVPVWFLYVFSRYIINNMGMLLIVLVI